MKLSEIHITPIIDSIRLEDIDDDTYFGDTYRNYISNSRLTLLEMNEKNPKRFFEGIKPIGGNKDYYIFGSATHELILQPESYVLCDSIDRPTAKLGAMADILYNKELSYENTLKASKEIGYYADTWTEIKAQELIKNCKNYWNERKEYEKTISKIPIYSDSKTRSRITNCVNSIKDNSDFTTLLNDGDIKGNEQTIFLNVKVECPDNEPFIFHLKSKLDNFTIKDGTITVNDLKTTGKPINEFDSAIDKFSYYRELAMYSYLLQIASKNIYKQDVKHIKGNFLTVESSEPFSTKVFPMTGDLFRKGMKEFTRLLKLAAFYLCLPEYAEYKTNL